MNQKLFESIMLESVKNSIYCNCKNTYPYSLPFPVSQRIILVEYSGVNANTPYDDNNNFLFPELDGQLPLNFASRSVKQSSALQKSLIEMGRNISLL